MHLCSNRVRIGSSVSSKVDDFSTNRKRICDILLVRHSRLTLVIWLISCAVSEIRRLIGWKLRIFLTPLSFSAAAPYVRFGISRWS